MNDDLWRLLATARVLWEMYSRNSGVPTQLSGSELGDIVYVFQAAEPYVVPFLKRTVEFYSTLDLSQHAMPVDRVARDLERLVTQLTISYRTGGSSGRAYTFSALEPEAQGEQRWRLV